MALVNQDLVLDVVPGPIPTILHLTEYDENMEVVVTLQRRGQPFQIPTGTTVKIDGTLKGHPFSENATPSGNTVTFTVSKNMTAYSGRAWTKVVLTKDSKPVSTCGFWLDCDRAGVEADTVIGAPGFDEQIADAVDDYLDDHQPFFTLPSGGQSGQALLSDGDDGAEWGNIAIDLDATLSHSGEAADAKATGKRISHNDDAREALVDETAPAYENLIDTSAVETECYYWTDGVHASAGYDTSDYMPVEVGKTYYYQYGGSMRNVRFLTAYDTAKNVIANACASSVAAATGYTVPSGVAYVRISVNSGIIGKPAQCPVYSTVGTVVSEYIPYGTPSTYALKDSALPALKYPAIAWEKGYTWYLDGTTLYKNAASNPNSTAFCAPIYLGGAVKMSVNAADGFAFKYFVTDADGNYISGSNTWYDTDVELQGNCYIVLTIRNPSKANIGVTIEEFNENFSIYGGLYDKVRSYESQISAVTSYIGIPYEYSYSGNPIRTKKPRYRVRATSLYAKPISQITSATVTAPQAFDSVNGVLFQLYSNNVALLIDVATGDFIGEVTAAFGHGNSMCFTETYAQSGDEFPIAIIADYDTSKLFFVRFTRSSASVIGQMTADGWGNRITAAFDALNSKLYVIGYTTGSTSDSDSGANKMIFSVYDWDSRTASGSNYSMTLIKRFNLPFINVVQGPQFFNGQIIIPSSGGASPIQTKLVVVDPFRESVNFAVSEFPNQIGAVECEGVCFVENDDSYEMLIKSNNGSVPYYSVDFGI